MNQYQHPLLRAYEFEQLLEDGVVNNRAEIARRYELSRARVTQVMKLLKLLEPAQEYVMGLPNRERRRFSGRRLRRFVALESRKARLDEFERLRREVEKQA